MNITFLKQSVRFICICRYSIDANNVRYFQTLQVRMAVELQHSYD